VTETQRTAAEPASSFALRWRGLLSAVLGAILLVSLIPLAIGAAHALAAGDVQSLLFYFLFLVLPANLGIIGTVLTVRRPRNRIGWLLLVSGVLAALTFGAGDYGRQAVAAGHLDAPLVQLALWFALWGFNPAIGMLIIFVPLLYPTGELLGPRWRIVVAVGILGFSSAAIGAAVIPGPMGDGAPDNPFGAPEPLLSWIETGSMLSNFAAPPVFLLALSSVLIRFRRSAGVERQQIKWFLFVAAIATVALGISVVVGSGPISDSAWILGLVTIAALPIAIGLAILRYGLYEIDRIVNRALVYGAVTAILAGVFAAATALAQRIFISAAGQSSDVAIVLETLVVVAVYAPVRKRVEALVDRYFKYDQRAYGPYLDELRRLLDLVDPGRAAARLAREARTHTGATGIAVMGPTGVLATAGSWPAEPSVNVPIGVAGAPLSGVMVGPRRDGKPHAPARLHELAEAAAVAATALAGRSPARAAAGLPQRPAAPKSRVA
jgi:hypothetical protein